MHPAHVFRKFGELSRKEQLLFSEAWFLHLSTGLILKVIPFRWIPRMFSSRQSETPVTAKSRTGSAGNEDQSRARTCPGAHGSAGTAGSGLRSELIEPVKTAVQRAGRFSPWRNRCLVSSLVARRMLSRRKIPSKLSLGVAKNPDGKTIAHAWLKAGEYEIVDRRGDYTELFSF